jgi:hypothetical protein
MPLPFLPQHGFLSHPFPNNNLFEYSDLYSYDSSFGMVSAQDSESSPGGQPSHQQSTGPTMEAIDQQSIGIDQPGGVRRELDRESVPPRTPHRHRNQVALFQIPSSTPLVRRIASYRHYLPSTAPKRANVPAREMGAYLAIELDNLTPIKIAELPQTIFPDPSLPFPVDTNLLQKLSNVWNPRTKKLFPPASYTERDVQDWLNAIAENIQSVTGTTASRFWSAQYCDTVLPNNELQRKPDIVLIKHFQTPLDWSGVHAVAEVTSRSTFHSEMKRTINNKTYLMFCTQHHRRFVPFLAVCSHKISFLVTDREGQAISEIYHYQEGEHNALMLIRILVALMFAADEISGVDPTMTPSKEGEIETISGNGKVYTVKSTVHVVRGIIGRSTRVWSAFDAEDKNKKLCIIKDGWIQEGRADAERLHLDNLKGIAGVPTLIWGGSVQIHDPKDPSRQQFINDDTAWIRYGFSDGSKYRIHRRLILSPVGENLSSFTSLGELIGALRDVAVGMSIHSLADHLYTLYTDSIPQ